jgi:F-type H+-transporting ATPase subunit alpha
MKQVAGTLRLDLAQYREKAAFAQFGSDLDNATRRQLARGEKLTEILKQDQYKPLAFEEQVLVIYAGTRGYTDEVETKSLKDYESQLKAYVDQKYPEILKEIRESGKIGDELKVKVDKAMTEFREIFK